MHIATVQLKSTPGSVYQQGNAIATKRPDKLSHDEHEQNTWRERGHYLPDGRMIIPAISFKRALEAGAAYNPRKLKGQATFTKLFERAIIVTDPIILPVTKDTVHGTPLYVPADGEASSKSTKKSSRVWRTFPTVHEWSGEMVFHVLDDRINESAFVDTLKDAGLYIGIGVWRPQRGGLNGRFQVCNLKWQ